MECVPETKARKIHIISARKIKNGNGQVLDMKSKDSPQPTSRTPLDGIAADSSISHSAKKSNPSAKKYSYKDIHIKGKCQQ